MKEDLIFQRINMASSWTLTQRQRNIQKAQKDQHKTQTEKYHSKQSVIHALSHFNLGQIYEAFLSFQGRIMKALSSNSKEIGEICYQFEENLEQYIKKKNDQEDLNAHYEEKISELLNQIYFYRQRIYQLENQHHLEHSPVEDFSPTLKSKQKFSHQNLLKNTQKTNFSRIQEMQELKENCWQLTTIVFELLGSCSQMMEKDYVDQSLYLRQYLKEVRNQQIKERNGNFFLSLKRRISIIYLLKNIVDMWEQNRD